MHAAALQYVRKISGTTKPSKANEAVFERAVREIAHISRHLLDDLVTTAPPRDREVEAARARARAAVRFGSVSGVGSSTLPACGAGDRPSCRGARSTDAGSNAPAVPDARLDLDLGGRPADDVEPVCLAEPVWARTAEAGCRGEDERSALAVVEGLEGASADRRALVDMATEHELGARRRKRTQRVVPVLERELARGTPGSAGEMVVERRRRGGRPTARRAALRLRQRGGRRRAVRPDVATDARS